MVLEVPFNFALDIIHKDNRFSQAFSEENFEFFPVCGHGSIVFNPVLVLLPIKKDLILKEGGCKRYAFMIFSSSCFEMVFALLTEVVIFYMQVSIV